MIKQQVSTFIPQKNGMLVAKYIFSNIILILLEYKNKLLYTILSNQ